MIFDTPATTSGRSAEGTVVRVGITDYAQDALGDVVFVDLPKVGTAVSVGGVIGEVESTKSVSEIYAPVEGTVTAVNEALEHVARTRQLRPLRRGVDLRDHDDHHERLRRAPRRRRVRGSDE